MTAPAPVHIHYRRPPDREDVFVQHLILDDPLVKVTFQPSTPVDAPVVIQGRTALEPGSPVVWFTFPGVWHDIGRFHTADGSYTGLYANILTPCRLHGAHSPSPLRWETTDLFLDVWLGRDGSTVLLDEADLDNAVDRGWVTHSTGERARREARRLIRSAPTAWPPSVVEDWPLERARAELERGPYGQSSSPPTR